MSVVFDLIVVFVDLIFLLFFGDISGNEVFLFVCFRKFFGGLFNYRLVCKFIVGIECVVLFVGLRFVGI